jgi:hypothetical protein
VYGIEGDTGLGGLAAQVPGGDRYLPAALGIRPTAGPLIGQAWETGMVLPNVPAAAMIGSVAMPVVSAGGQAVEHPPGRLIPGELGSLVDFHNSPLPWLILAALLLYGWLHVSLRVGGRRLSIG